MAQKKQNKTPKKNDQHSKNKRKIPITVLISVIVVLALMLLFTMNNCNQNNEPEYYSFTKDGELTFTDSLGNSKITIDLEIADNEYKRQLGLMNRSSMKENQGMLFIFPDEEIQSFWMRNTLISLDMIFVNKNKKIVTIHKNTKILSSQSYSSTEPAMYVIEVDGGFTDRHHIVRGDKIYWMRTTAGS